MEAGLFSKLLQEYWLPASPGETLKWTLQLAADEKVDAQHMAAPFLENQLYSHCLKKMDLLAKRIADWEAEEPEHGIKESVLVARSLALLGKSAARNFVTCVRQNQMMDAGIPRKKGGRADDQKNRLVVNPREQILHALTAEDFCQENMVIDHHLAYQAGLHYDWLKALLNKNKAPKDIQNALAEAFKEGMIIGRMAYRITGRMGSVKFSKSVFATGLLVPIGKVFMTYAYPKELKERSWTGFLTEMKKITGHEFDAAELIEHKRFPTTFPEFSALWMSFMGLNADAEKAVHYLRDPYALKTIRPDLYQLSMILSLSHTMSAWIGGFQAQLEAMIKAHHRTWLTQSKLSVKDLQKIAEEVKAGRDLHQSKGQPSGGEPKK